MILTLFYLTGVVFFFSLYISDTQSMTKEEVKRNHLIVISLILVWPGLLVLAFLVDLCSRLVKT